MSAHPPIDQARARGERWFRRIGLQACLVVAVMLGLASPSRANDQDMRMIYRQAEADRIASPFVRSGEAIWFRAPESHYGGLAWKPAGVEPGHRYSISFFFMNHDVEPGGELKKLVLTVYDGNTIVHSQNLYRQSYAQFYAVELEFGSSDVVARLDVPAGESVVVGEIGRAVDVADLATTRHPLNMHLWMPTLVLPDVYRGLRKFELEVGLSNRRRSELFGLEEVTVRAGMKVASANLPRLLPGRNRLHVVSEAGTAGGQIEVTATPRSAAGAVRLHVEHDAVVPADGATFGRAFISAVDSSGDLVSGAFLRVLGPPDVDVRPFERAIADARKLQFTREFHYTSTTPGEAELQVERWTGHDWVETGERFTVRFAAVDDPAPAFRRTDYVRRWFEPQAVAGAEAGATNWTIALDGTGNDVTRDLSFESELAPRVDWVVRGPVHGLGLFADFQPDPRTIRTKAESLWQRFAAGTADPERAFALAVEAHVGLVMEGLQPEEFAILDYPSFGRILREGRGWCNQYAEGVQALAVEGGLEARLRNLPKHVTDELRGADLPVSHFDAMMLMGVTDATGRRTALNDLEAGARVLGAGVDGFTVRGGDADYLHDPLPKAKPWLRRDPTDPVYRNRFLDDRILTIDLATWETLQWKGGSLPPQEFEPVRGLRAENQSVLVQQSRLKAEDLIGNPAAQIRRLGMADNGLLAPAGGFDVGSVTLPLSYPLEVSDLIVELAGSVDVGGGVKIGLRPDLAPPLITDADPW